MGRLRQLSMAAVLALMLAPGAFAGIIGTVPGTIETPPGTIETPPAPPPASATGTIETPPSGAQPGVSVPDPAVDLVLDLMQSVLSLL